MPCLIPDVMTTSFNGPRSRYGDILRRFPACGERKRLAVCCGSAEEVVMKAWMVVAFVAAALALSAPTASAGNKSGPQAKAATADATDFSARRVYRRYPSYPAYARYPSYPAYYARPYYYRPYPYGVPVPFFLGFGYLPYY
jgi:hypothetical protein